MYGHYDCCCQARRVRTTNRLCPSSNLLWLFSKPAGSELISMHDSFDLLLVDMVPCLMEVFVFELSYLSSCFHQLAGSIILTYMLTLPSPVVAPASILFSLFHLVNLICKELALSYLFVICSGCFASVPLVVVEKLSFFYIRQTTSIPCDIQSSYLTRPLATLNLPSAFPFTIPFLALPSSLTRSHSC
ncbi:hypothetical protein AA313_de0202696 [Arthrobotrys entomopaga]|nr:hypothetical protein AA313_de0202696 [Arthrobotrys entomopaga]